MKKRFAKILFVVFLLIIILLSVFVYRQWNNIRAFYLFLVSDGEDVNVQIDKMREELQEELEKEHGIIIEIPQSQPSEDIIDNTTETDETNPPETTPPKVTDAPETTPPKVTDAPETKPPKVTEPPETDPPETKPAKTAQEIVDACVAELYVCKKDIFSALGDLKQEKIDIWNNLSPEERTNEKKLELGFEALDECYEYEVKVDKQVQDILAKYRKELEAIGADTGVLNVLWKYYCEEKAIEKAYYLDKYM